jgi:large subunit ribosomal protein L6
MSRVGRLPITIPAGVTVERNGDTIVVKGPKGTLSERIVDKHIIIEIEAGVITLSRSREIKETKAKHGLYRQLIANMVKGVSEPFTRTLLVSGVGWKTSVAGGKLVMNIGYSHPVEFFAPEGITIACPDANTIVVSGINKQLVGQTAATIRSKRPVEPYHGYGLRYNDEVVVRKEGKTGSK